MTAAACVTDGPPKKGRRMSRRLDKETFVKRSIKVHGERYDYSKVEYLDTNTKVCIVCPEHGEFWQTPKNHMKGYGCSLCAIKKRNDSKMVTTSGFISKARAIHGTKYDYSKVEYVDYVTPVCIICPEHGEFWQSPTRHLNSVGCPMCAEEKRGGDKRYDAAKFVSIARALYGDKYSYDKTVYKNSRTPVIVTCPVHGDITMLPSYHLHVCGCPMCSKDAVMERREMRVAHKMAEQEQAKERAEETRRRNALNFIEKSKEVHNGFYSYDDVKYVNSSTPVSITCPIHGNFDQRPNNHLQGSECPQCARERMRQVYRMGQDAFIARARAVHGNRYDYSRVVYGNNQNDKVCIVCPKHGEYWQAPNMHLNEGQGCPMCGTLSSKGETEILSWIKECLPEVEVEQRNKSVMEGRELDIYIPSLKIAVEYNGLRWHSERFGKDKFYHLTKTEECKKKGVRLLQIFEDEWIYKKDIAKEKIAHIIGCGSARKSHIYGRACQIREVDYGLAKRFLDTFHIQGGVRASVYLGGYYNDELVGVMTFLKDKNGFVLNRFATISKYNVVGLGGKLFSYFTKKYNPELITTYSDRRWHTENDNLYTKLGFEIKEILQPDYMYVTSKNSYRLRYHKFNFRKSILHRKYGLPLTMTEKEMTEQLGYYKIWDCGLIKYVWQSKTEREYGKKIE